jgi:ABC-type glycerol-3-phosphate transport system substrate-binding protein
MKKWLGFILFISLAFGIVFAGGQRANEQAQGARLTMWVRTPETVDLLRESIQRFQANNPGVVVEIVPFAADAYPAALQAAISGQSLPDIFQVHNSVPVPRLVELNLIQSLGGNFTPGFVDQFDPATWWEGSTTINGEIFAWPDRSFRRASLFLFYNREVMRKSGLNPNNPPRTWDQFIQQSQQVTDRGNGRRFGLHLGFTSGWFNERVVLQLATTVGNQFGVPAEHLPGRAVNWRTGEVFAYQPIQEVARFFQRMMERDAIHPDFLNTGRSQATAQWAAGQSAFLIDGSWRLQELLRNEPDLDFGITMLPSRDGGPVLWGVEGGSQNAFAVSSRSPNVAIATKLFEHLTQDYYPMLLKGAVDLTPIPALNNNQSLFTSPQFLELVRLTELGTMVLPSPVVRNQDQLVTIGRLAAKPPRRPIGESMQGFFAQGQFDVSDFMRAYTAEMNQFFDEAIQEARTRGANVNPNEWVFPDWNPRQNYY